MSNNEYEHQSYWTTLNKRLNEEQESICLETNKKGDCLMSSKFVIIDQSTIEPPFFETLKNKL